VKRVSREERARQVAECEASGLTVREWCVANGVPEATMHWWRRRLREDEGAALAPAFVEVAAVGAGRAAAAAAPIVARVGGVEILLPPGFGGADAAAAMRAAASL